MHCQWQSSASTPTAQECLSSELSGLSAKAETDLDVIKPINDSSTQTDVE
jgi:hypothetical protein